MSRDNLGGSATVPQCEINENFGMSYAYINVKDHTKATIYNHAYKYNSNKRRNFDIWGYVRRPHAIRVSVRKPFEIRDRGYEVFQN